MFEHFTQIASGSGNYLVCPVCSYTMKDEGGCLRCEQDREYECSLNADGGSTTDNPVALNLDELRSRRVAVLSDPGSAERGSEDEGDMAEGGTHHAQAPRDQASPPTTDSGDQACPSDPGSGDQPSHYDSDLLGRLLTVHWLFIRTDLIEHFTDPSVMNVMLILKVLMKGAN